MVALSTAVVGFFLAPMTVFERVLAAIAGLVFIAPSWQADLLAFAIVAPVLFVQLLRRRRSVAPAPA